MSTEEKIKDEANKHTRCNSFKKRKIRRNKVDEVNERECRRKFFKRKKKNILRLFAEFENYKKRTTKRE